MDSSFNQIINELFDFSPPPPPQNTSLNEQVDHISKKRKSSSIAFENNVDNNNAVEHKKKIIERQRRQEMSSLFQSLRSLLPIQCLKGKRSVADHLHETVGYIKQLQKKIEDLNGKSETLKKFQHHRLFSAGIEHSGSCSWANVTVKTSVAGVETAVDTAFREGMKLSEVINILTEEGLSIISCNYTKVDGRLLIVIESEVNEGTTIDSAKLQEKLTEYYCNRY